MTSGMDISRRYWLAHGLPGLEKDFPQLLPLAAAGLMGEGSECLKFDDHLSQDHDWGPGFCLWIPDDLYEEFQIPLTRWYDALPGTFEGWPVKTVSALVPSLLAPKHRKPLSGLRMSLSTTNSI